MNSDPDKAMSIAVLKDMNTLADTVDAMNQRFSALMEKEKYTAAKKVMADRGQIIDALTDCQKKLAKMQPPPASWEDAVKLAQLVEEKLNAIKAQDQETQEQLKQYSEDARKKLNALQTGKDVMNSYAKKVPPRGKSFTA